MLPLSLVKWPCDDLLQLVGGVTSGQVHCHLTSAFCTEVHLHWSVLGIS